jgi:hypothetical protein
LARLEKGDLVTQLDLPLGIAPAKRPDRGSGGRKSIDRLVRHLLDSGAVSSVEDLLDQVSSIPGRKLFNALLAIAQMPHATLLHSDRVWEERWGRRVKPGQRPLVLLFPFGPVEFVYDVSQTEPTEDATPLPFDATPFAMESVAVAADAMATLVKAVKPLGVRVVDARQGVALAGHVQRVTDAGTLTLPSGGPVKPPREVRVRWLVQLNSSHSPTEQLATMAHELGHLFCGHVGADQGDDWPSRELPDRVQREFEAESVARLVFRRVAPGAALPPYLEHILEPGQPPPDEGWTHVAQAADRVLDLLARTTAR